MFWISSYSLLIIHLVYLVNELESAISKCMWNDYSQLDWLSHLIMDILHYSSNLMLQKAILVASSQIIMTIIIVRRIMHDKIEFVLHNM